MKLFLLFLFLCCHFIYVNFSISQYVFPPLSPYNHVMPSSSWFWQKIIIHSNHIHMYVNVNIGFLRNHDYILIQFHTNQKGIKIQIENMLNFDSLNCACSLSCQSFQLNTLNLSTILYVHVNWNHIQIINHYDSEYKHT